MKIRNIHKFRKDKQKPRFHPRNINYSVDRTWAYNRSVNKRFTKWEIYQSEYEDYCKWLETEEADLEEFDSCIYKIIFNKISNTNYNFPIQLPINEKHSI